ncbi:uncharacterized protein LOC108655903 [Drosophila navojoa]|uniref:uncharacterized protein LOC108655903 n=1 Tax=Drosophila navojoa TaxID=7232 RepID=UPI0011BE6298|nr:uncharacterized protein LOC108655903 [Drosophila navojoa]
MSDKIPNYNNILEALQSLSLDSERNLADTKNGSNTPSVPNDTHDDLPCRTPQTAGEMDNSDDMDMSSDVIVVDSSSASSDVSIFWSSDTNASSTESVLEVDQWEYSETETIPETESDSNINGTKDSCIMDNFVSKPIKRKHDDYLNKKESKSGPLNAPNLGADVNASPVLKRSITTTRSGRAVRARIDNKFDYSSEPQEVDSDDSDDPDFGDNELEDDDDDDDEEYVQDNHSEPTRKQRRISTRNSFCSSNASSLLESDAFIYLDLSRSVAIVTSEPTTDEAVEFDSELKIRLQKFLGLVARQRRLYNPMANFEYEDNHMDEDESPSYNRLWTSNASVQPQSTPTVPDKRNPEPSRIRALGSNLTNEMKILLMDDMVQRVNANYFESKTPDHIKEPIDLSGLPSEEQRALTCQHHKKIASMIKPQVTQYNFVDSLRSTTPLTMCHPLAVNYRKRDFGACKEHLAKILFHILNHQIFHCGLRPEIVWRSCMNSLSSIEHRIESGGQRRSRIILWQNIKQPGMVVKELLHGMCHAAAFQYHGETGHGDNCRKWAYRAKSLMPELPEIVDCNASYKYTCLLCRARSFGSIKFEDEAPQLRCFYCQFEVIVESCIDDIYNLSFTDHLVTPYKEFVRANYGTYQQSGHSAKMRALNVLYREHQQQLSSN